MKMNLKKVISAILIGSMLAATLASCKKTEVKPEPAISDKGAKATPSPSPSPEAKLDPITLSMSWWGTDTRHEAYVAAIDLYMAKNPHVTVKPNYSGWDGYHDALVVQVGGGNAPDVFGYGGGYRLQFGNGDALVDYGEYIDDYTFLQELKPIIDTDTYKVKNRITSVPSGISTASLAFNKRVFDDAGVAYPTDDTTWVGLFEIWNQIALNSPPEVFGDSGWFWTPENLFSMAKSMGKDFETNQDKRKTEPNVVSFDRDFAKDVYTRNEALWEVGALVRAQDDDIEFVTGLIATSVAASSGLLGTIASVPDEVGFCLPPGKFDEGGRVYLDVPGPPINWGVPSNAKSIPASLELLNFLLSDPEAVAAIGLAAGAPAVPSGLKALQESYGAGTQEAEILDLITRAFARADELVPVPAIFGKAEASAAFKVELENYVYGVLTMDAFIDEAERVMNEKYAEFWEPTE